MNSFCAFSGGKDSTALALLSPESFPVFTDTGWEPDEIYSHIERFEKATGREVIRIRSKKHKSLPDLIREKKYLPGFKTRYCTRLFKIEPYNEFINDNLPAELLVGLRADEEERVGNTTLKEGLHIRYPLREMGLTESDVLKICSEANLLPEYPTYMSRGGCIGCYFKSKNEVRAMHKLRPDLLDELQDLEESIQDKRTRYAIMFPNIKMSIRDYRKAIDLFHEQEDDGYDRFKKNTSCGIFCHK